MSLDYPFYDELRRSQHLAAKWWLWGDILYYLGLLPAVILAIPALWSLLRLRSAAWLDGRRGFCLCLRFSLLSF
jgi:hypothetical protein